MFGNEVLSVDPVLLREELTQLTKLIDQAVALEKRRVKSELNKVREVFGTGKVFTKSKMKLIVVIQRPGQESTCLVINFMTQNTREGRVLTKLLDRLKEIGKDLGTDQIFGALGEVFPSNRAELPLRQMYARQTDEHSIQEQIVEDTRPEQARFMDLMCYHPQVVRIKCPGFPQFLAGTTPSLRRLPRGSRFGRGGRGGRGLPLRCYSSAQGILAGSAIPRDRAPRTMSAV